MIPTRLLRLTMPVTLLVAWELPYHVSRASSFSMTCVLFLTAMIAAGLERPFRAERLPARSLVLVLLCPAGMTKAVAAPLGLYSSLELASVLASILLFCVVSRFALIWRQLPEGRRRAFMAINALSPRFVELVRVELALLWFGLFRWRRHDADSPVPAIIYPATGMGVEVTMCWLTALGFVIETPLLHVLLAHVWNMTAAWTCSGLHALLCIYLIGYAKSLSLRPTLLFPDRIEIRLGVVARRIVPLAAIDRLSLCGIKEARQPDEQRLFGFDEPNLRLSTAGSRILFRVDEPARLIAALGLY